MAIKELIYYLHTFSNSHSVWAAQCITATTTTSSSSTTTNPTGIKLLLLLYDIMNIMMIFMIVNLIRNKIKFLNIIYLSFYTPAHQFLNVFIPF